MRTAFGYVRVSTEQQASEGISLEAQKGKIVAWCELNGYALSSLFVDDDKHDVCLPEVDGRGVIRALRLKGTNVAKDRARSSTFAQDVSR